MAYIPTASELADHFAAQSNFPDAESRELTKVSQYFTAIIGRTGLHNQLHDIFSFRQDPGSVHAYLADAASHASLLIVTTNYDDLIERAFDKVGRPYDVVVHASHSHGRGDVFWRPHGDQPKELLSKDLDIDLSASTVIYKIHGSIDRSANPRREYVITEDDYIDFLARMTNSTAIPKIFAEPFQKHPFLFLGYGLYDWNLRVVLNRIHRELRRPDDIKSWAVETQSKPLEKKLWSMRNVNVFDGLTLDEFIDGLRNAAGAKKE